MKNFDLVSLKLFALQALAYAEQKGREILVTEGRKLLGAEKEEVAVRFVVEQYARLTANVPVLNLTDVDDKFVEAEARKAVRAAFAEVGAFLNRLAKPAVVDAPELTPGGLE